MGAFIPSIVGFRQQVFLNKDEPSKHAKPSDVNPYYLVDLYDYCLIYVDLCMLFPYFRGQVKKFGF